MSLDITWQDDTQEQEKAIIFNSEDSELKNIIVNYVGDKLKPDNDEVDVSMIVGVLAEEFPELVLLVAEENWLRGYRQGLDDLGTFGEE